VFLPKGRNRFRVFENRVLRKIYETDGEEVEIT
jgi:hypothetical protein